MYRCAPKVDWAERRPSEMRTYQFTATPIENSPLDQLNCIRLQDPGIFPTIKGWEKKFVASRNYFSKEPETFKNLEEMGLMLDAMTHQVDKEDPDIAKMFPKVREKTIYIDWHPKDRAVYDKLQDIAAELSKQAKKDPEVKKLNALQLIGVLQMLCDAPSMVQKSAENREEFEAILAEMTAEEQEALGPNFLSGSEAALLLLRSLKRELTDEYSTKIETLREIVMEKHPNEKIVIFSRLADYIQPILAAKFKEWGVTYVVYRGTDKQRREAKDQFRTDPNIRLFLSSDSGSDSIDLPEASVAIDFDLPLKWSTKVQRRNRIHRVNSMHEFVTFYTLLMANSVEDRIAEIIEKKYGYHLAIFKGEMAEEAISARMTADDLYYILTGEQPEELADA
jgi:SNF2 family DNA or RNA helicase